MFNNKLYTFNELDHKTQLKVIQHHRNTQNKEELTNILKNEVLNVLKLQADFEETDYNYYLKNTVNFYFNITFNLIDFIKQNGEALKELLTINGEELKDLADWVKDEKIIVIINNTKQTENDYKNSFLTVEALKGVLLEGFLIDINKNGFININTGGADLKRLGQLLAVIEHLTALIIKVNESMGEKTYLYFKDISREETENFYKYTFFNKRGVPIPYLVLKHKYKHHH